MSIIRSESVRIGATSARLKAMLAVLLVWVGCVGATAHAEPCHSYSFKNDAGVTEYSNSIPAEQANRGYSCLDEHLAVIEVVPPKLTPEQQAQRERDAAAEKAAKEAGLPRPRSDEELRQLYASVHDVEEARDRNLAAMDDAIVQARKDLEALKLRRRDAEKQAADAERQGQSPHAEVLKNLEILDGQIVEAEGEIEKRIVRKQHAAEQYRMDLEGVKRLYSR